MDKSCHTLTDSQPSHVIHFNWQQTFCPWNATSCASPRIKVSYFSIQYRKRLQKVLSIESSVCHYQEHHFLFAEIILTVEQYIWWIYMSKIISLSNLKLSYHTWEWNDAHIDLLSFKLNEFIKWHILERKWSHLACRHKIFKPYRHSSWRSTNEIGFLNVQEISIR